MFSLVNAALLGAALVVMFVYPAYAAYALYAIVGWVVAGLTLTWSGWTSGPHSASTATSISPLPGAIPLATGSGRGAATPPPTIDFCVFCGRRYNAADRVCTDCGHPLPRAA